MRLREDVEPTLELRGAQKTVHKTSFCGLLVSYGTLAVCSAPTARTTLDEPGIKLADVCVILNDGYHNAANSESREHLQPPNAVVLRLQSGLLSCLPNIVQL